MRTFSNKEMDACHQIMREGDHVVCTQRLRKAGQLGRREAEGELEGPRGVREAGRRNKSPGEHTRMLS